MIKLHTCEGLKKNHGQRNIKYEERDSGEKFWVIDVTDNDWVAHIKYCPYCSKRLLPKNIIMITTTQFVEEN